MIRQLVIDTIKDNIIDRYCDFSGTISRGALWRFMLVEHLIVGVCLAVLGLLSLHSALFIYNRHSFCVVVHFDYGPYIA